MTFISHYNSPLGGITLAATNDRLCGLWFDGQKYFGSTIQEETEEEETPVSDPTVARPLFFRKEARLPSPASS